jgi:hypothetical protein
MKVGQPVAINGNRQCMSEEPDPQVVPKAERRRFSAEYKRRILAEADACSGPQDSLMIVKPQFDEDQGSNQFRGRK